MVICYLKYNPEVKDLLLDKIPGCFVQPGIFYIIFIFILSHVYLQTNVCMILYGHGTGGVGCLCLNDMRIW